MNRSGNTGQFHRVETARAVCPPEQQEGKTTSPGERDSSLLEDGG